jgi:hypothetical protein
MEKRIVFRKPTRLVTTEQKGPRPIAVDYGRAEALQAFTEGMGNGR